MGLVGTRNSLYNLVEQTQRAVSRGIKMLAIPELKTFLVSKKHRMILDMITNMSSRDEIFNCCITGPTGCGKTELINQYCATTKRQLYIHDTALDIDAGSRFGFTDLVGENGSQHTEYVPGGFLTAITTPYAVVHISEINRPENEKSLNSLLSILDDTRAIYINELQETVKVAKGVTFFATLNEGYDYIGTIPVDEALRGRFYKMELGPLPRASMELLLPLKVGLNAEKSTQLLDLVEKLSTNTQEPVYISTRDVINIATLLKHNLPIIIAFEMVLLGAKKANNVVESLLLQEHLSGNETFDNSGFDKYEFMIRQSGV
jgi:nitric oxide reductase NorQ protein